MEVAYPFCDNSFKFLEKLTGTPTHIPDFRIGIDPIKYFNIEKEKIFYKFGKETSSKYGIRKNYLEKAFYEKNIKTNFDYEKYKENYYFMRRAVKTIRSYTKLNIKHILNPGTKEKILIIQIML